MAEQLVELKPSGIELLMLLTGPYEPLRECKCMSTYIDSVHYVSEEGVNDERRQMAGGTVLTQLHQPRCSSAPTLNGISVDLQSYTYVGTPEI